jgi:hypothetical protein
MTSWVKYKTGLSVNRQARFAATSFSDDMQISSACQVAIRDDDAVQRKVN